MPNIAKTKLTHAELLAMRLDGASYTLISKHAGISRQRVQQILAPPKEIRDIIIARYESRCANCGIIIGKQGHVHHIGSKDGDTYNDIENLELLCVSCHMNKHFNKESKRDPMATRIEYHTTKRRVRLCACNLCGHAWRAQGETWPPRICPKCHSRKWNRKKVE